MLSVLMLSTSRVSGTRSSGDIASTLDALASSSSLNQRRTSVGLQNVFFTAYQAKGDFKRGQPRPF